jgi:hypothetical protein
LQPAGIAAKLQQMVLTLLATIALARMEGSQPHDPLRQIFISIRMSDEGQCQYWSGSDVGLNPETLPTYLKSFDERSKSETPIHFMEGDDVSNECIVAGMSAAIKAGFKKVSQPSR